MADTVQHVLWDRFGGVHFWPRPAQDPQTLINTLRMSNHGECVSTKYSVEMLTRQTFLTFRNSKLFEGGLYFR
jgi:hypothetical protein